MTDIDEFFDKWRKENPPEPIKNIEMIHSPELKEHLELIVSEHVGFYVEIHDSNRIHVYNFHGAGYEYDWLIPFYKEGFQLVDIRIEKMDDDYKLDDDWNKGVCVTLTFDKEVGDLMK